MTDRSAEAPDGDLVRRFLAGDAGAGTELITRHERRVYAVCLRVLGNPDDAADAAQDALLAMVRKLDGFRGEAAFTTWLYRVAMNVCYDHLRRARRQPMLRRSEEDAAPEPALPDHADAVADANDVAAALAQVPEDFRVAIVLADVHDLPYEEIAEGARPPGRHGEVAGTPRPDRVGPCPGDRTGRGTDPAREDVRGNTTMSHPEPLLADYVDGSLDPSTRAEVDAHLRGCATCRAEVSLARAGSQRAQGLADPAAPAGIGEAAIAEAARLATERNPEVTPIAGRGRRRPATPRILAAAGAAALLLLVVLVAPKLGQDNTSSASRAAAGTAARHERLPERDHGRAPARGLLVRIPSEFRGRPQDGVVGDGRRDGRCRPRGRGYADAGSCRLRCGDGLRGGPEPPPVGHGVPRSCLPPCGHPFARDPRDASKASPPTSAST